MSDPLDNWSKPKVVGPTNASTNKVRVEDLGGGLFPGDPAGEPRNTSDPFEQALRAIFEDALQLLLKKHHDYGPLNIARAPGGALNGLRVRKWDKLARINNLLDSGAEPENESLRDSFLDDLNYSAIAMMVLDGEWPGCD